MIFEIVTLTSLSSKTLGFRDFWDSAVRRPPRLCSLRAGRREAAA
jgi:hypothetical protein